MLRTTLWVLIGLLLLAVATTAQDNAYTVQYGDVLDLIAAGFDKSAACIAEANALTNPNRLRPGDVLTIPGNCPPYDGLALGPRQPEADAPGQGGGGGTTRTLSSGNAYVVQPGDVLDLIGAAFNVAPSCIARTNDLSDAGRIFPGDELVIDTSCPPYDGLAFVTGQGSESLGQGGGGGSSNVPRGNVYIVGVGDVLDLIGAAYNVAPSCIADNNNLANPNAIFPGDELLISASCPPYDGLATSGRLLGSSSAGTGGGAPRSSAPEATPTEVITPLPQPELPPTPTPEAGGDAQG